MGHVMGVVFYSASSNLERPDDGRRFGKNVHFSVAAVESTSTFNEIYAPNWILLIRKPFTVWLMRADMHNGIYVQHKLCIIWWFVWNWTRHYITQPVLLIWPHKVLIRHSRRPPIVGWEASGKCLWQSIVNVTQLSQIISISPLEKIFKLRSFYSLNFLGSISNFDTIIYR